MPPYRQLLADTLEWAAPGPGERWLDLGCGGGALTRAIWERTGGTVAEIVGTDCAPANARAYERLRTALAPSPGSRIAFLCHDFSTGLGPLADGAFDHAMSGLSISYAESRNPTTGGWTADAYDRLLNEVARVLRPGGRFVFSVNVPDPSWGRIAWLSLGAALRAERPLRYLKRAGRMWRYGRWLTRGARSGRFHYLPPETVAAKLSAAGFGATEHRLSYAGQALVFRTLKRT
ncbi:class I SAM-dependent methyltransferase [Gemmata massiliana]|uniref:class I SAM-dependent methyltransferase n=1 Tax=Gemmata massiliana TaxID=1210884 RepID=UPI001E352665|nr:class I SAM-dependent methyltransferase [Gemmata massiliana]